jgi:hypothetical protein
MLKLTFVMRQLTIIFLSILELTLAYTFGNAQVSSQAEITAPRVGDAVQGVVAIMGSTPLGEFQSYELSFTVTGDSETWFIIKKSNQPVQNDILGEWDTTNLTDNTYTLRLVVQVPESAPTTVLVEGIRVRNYSPVETNTPAPTETPDPGEPPTPTSTNLPPTPTKLARNPAILTDRAIAKAFWFGAGSTFFLLSILALYNIIINRQRK